MVVTPSKSFVLIAANKGEKIEWMLDLQKAAEEWKMKKSTFGIRGSEQDEAPVWIPDEKVSKCPKCNEAFTLMKRRVRTSDS